MLARHATVDDVAAIKALVDWGASIGELVPCPAEELAERLDQFWVVADLDQILGVCALRPVAENLAELCSLETAKTLGLTIPQSVLGRADQVIE